MRRSVAEFLLSFLLGAAWAFALIGALTLFFSFLPFGLWIALLAATIGALGGFVAVVVLEAIALQFEKVHLLRKQIDLLDHIRMLLEERNGDDTVRDHRSSILHK